MSCFFIAVQLVQPNDPTRSGYTFSGWYSDEAFTISYTFPETMPLSLTLYAKWTANAQTITFIENNGSEVTNINQDYDSILVQPNDPTRSGYTFSGWYSDEALTSAYTFPETMPLSITLYAKWTANLETISFEENGGSKINNITQDFDSALVQPDDTTRTGYTFGGWYSDEALTSAYTFPETMPLSFTLYAKWTANAQTITFIENNGSEVSNINQDYDSVLELPNDPTRIGYTFSGWYSDEALTSAYTFPETMPLSITLYAKWTANLETISFEENGGSKINNITQDFDSALVQPDNPTRTGYTFSGWYSDEALTSAYTFPETMPLSFTLYAKWTANAQTIVFEENGGSEVINITQDYDSILVQPNDPTRIGYTFSGWYTDEAVSKAYTFPETMPLSITIYAKWIANFETIDFEENGGSKVTDIHQDYGTLIVQPNDPARTGYTFNGWYSDEALTTAYNFPETMPLSITLYAKWTANTETITFEENGGPEVANITQDFGTAFVQPDDPTRIGYTFGGWYSDEVLTTSYTFPETMPLSLTLYAKWTANAETITFMENGGSEVADIHQDYGTALAQPNNPTRTGYTFVGWFSDEAFTTIYEYPETMPLSITLYAKWIANAEVITFEENGGPEVANITQDFGTAFVQPDDPTRIGYTFGGWFSDEALTTSYTFPETMPLSLSLYAKWTANVETISFEENGGSEVTDIHQDYGTALAQPNNPSRTGYTFRGWFTDETLTSTYTFPEAMPLSLTLYAKWTANTETITFVENGGSEVANINQDYDTALDMPTPIRTGYTFTGWYSDAALTTPYTFPETMSLSITLYAGWVVNSETITFEENGGTEVANITQDYSTDLVQPEDPTRTGYTFSGWFSDEALTTVYDFSETMPLSVTIYAKWTINSYIVEYMEDDGTVIQSNEYDYNTLLSDALAPTNPTRTGYTFNGWSKTLPTNMPAENISLYATWVCTEVNADGIEPTVEGVDEAIAKSEFASQNVEVVVDIDMISVEELAEEEVVLLENITNKKEAYIGLDISLYATTSDNESETPIHETNHNITITLSIPTEQQGYKNYSIVRIHNGEAQILETTYNEEDQTITFETNQFSTYIIKYDVSSFNWLIVVVSAVALSGVVYLVYKRFN